MAGKQKKPSWEEPGVPALEGRTKAVRGDIRRIGRKAEKARPRRTKASIANKPESGYVSSDILCRFPYGSGRRKREVRGHLSGNRRARRRSQTRLGRRSSHGGYSLLNLDGLSRRVIHMIIGTHANASQVIPRRKSMAMVHLGRVLEYRFCWPFDGLQCWSVAADSKFGGAHQRVD